MVKRNHSADSVYSQVSSSQPGDPALQPPKLNGYSDFQLAGQGGMGLVYKAWNDRLQRHEAIKLIRTPIHADVQEAERFKIEAEMTASLDHPNIVSVYGAGQTRGQSYIAMQWVDGQTLADLIRTTAITPRDAAVLAVKVAHAIHYAHRLGILHRDIKPANVLIDRDGEPLVADFGLAKRLDGSVDLTQTGAVVGTPGYMAPEQALGKRNITTAADIYAIGALIYEMVTGQPPFVGDTPVDVIKQAVDEPPVSLRRRNADVHRDLEAVCLKCLEKDPRERYASCDDLAGDLSRFLNGQIVDARPPGLWDWFRQAGRTKPSEFPDYSWHVLVWLGAILLMTHVVAFAVVAAGWSVFSFLVVQVTAVACGLTVLWWFMARRFRRLPETEKHAMTVAIGHLFAQTAAVLAFAPTDLRLPAIEAVGAYPAIMCLSGLSFFILGSTHWSRFFPIGLCLMLLALWMVRWPAGAPLIYGVSLAACLWYWAYSLKITFRGENL